MFKPKSKPCREKLKKRIAAALLAGVIAASAIPLSAYAAAGETVRTISTLADIGAGDELPDYRVTSLSLSGKTAAVSYNAKSSCTLVAAIYTDDGIKMLGSGKTSVQGGYGSVNVDIDIDELPEVYMVKAFLLDTATNAPLGKAYENTDHAYHGEVIESGEWGDNITWKLYEDGTLIISGSGPMSEGTYGSGNYHSPWEGNPLIKRVVMEDGITSTCPHAFYQCINLESVVFSNTLEHLHNWSFMECFSLKSIVLPDSVSQFGGCVFEDCVSLESITLGKQSHLFEGIFQGCSNVSKLIIPESLTEIADNGLDGAGDNLKTAGPIGSGCDVEFGWKDAIPKGVFFGFGNMISIDLPDTITSIGESAFLCCENLKNIRIPAAVNNIGEGAFEGCRALESIDVDINNSAYSSVDGVLFNKEKTELIKCPGGKKGSYTIPDGITSICSDAFDDCYELNDIYFEGTFEEWQKLSLTNSAINYARLHCTSAEPKSGTCGDDMAWLYDGNDLLTITGSGAMKNYSNDKQPWNDIKALISRVVFEGDITGVGNYAFQGCGGLTSITIPDSVTSIGYGAFRGCSSLTSITIPDAVTSIDYRTFDGCSGLTSITIPNAVTSIEGYAFSGCSSLTSITIPNAVTSIKGYAFSGCSSLTSITIPDSVTSIGEGVFSGCSGLTSITIPDSVTSIGYDAFNGCSGLTSITIPDSVTFIGNFAFNGCSGLTSITIPDSVTSIGNFAFSGCSSLTNITIPDSVTFIGNFAFNGCSSLTSITIPDSVTSIGGSAFQGCSDLRSIKIPDAVTSIGYRAFFGCSGLTSVTIPSSVTNIGNNAFFGCNSVTDVYYGGTEEQWNAITIEGYLNHNNYFLHPATIHFTEPPVTVIASGECGENVTWTLDSHGTLTISGSGEMTERPLWKKYDEEHEDGIWLNNEIVKVVIESGITSIGESAFDNCQSLTSVHIPNSVVSIEEGAFAYCMKLTDISVDSGNDNLLVSDGVLFNKSKNKLICYPCGKVETSYVIPDTVTELGDYAFCCNEYLMSVVIPDSVLTIAAYNFVGLCMLENIIISNNVTSIGDHSFLDCDKLEELNFPASLTSIGEWSLVNNDKLRNILVDANNQYFSSENGVLFNKNKTELILYPNGIASTYAIPNTVTSIGDFAFALCTSLTNVTIPESVTSIDEFAFFECNSLTDVYYGGTEEQWNAITIGSDNDPLTNATIHFADATVSEVEDTAEAPEEAPVSDLITEAEPISAGHVDGLFATATALQNVHTVTFDDLIPGTEYAFIAVRSGSAGDLLASDNLLYIDQRTADEEGKVTFTYELREQCEGVELMNFGKPKTDIALADVNAPSLYYTGEEQTAEITVTYDGKKLVQDEDYKINGTTSAKAPGRYEFTVVGEGTFNGEVKGYFHIIPTEIRLDTDKVTLYAGTTFTPNVYLYPTETGESVTWTSSDETKATVDENGVITAVAKGKATITATAESGLSASLVVTVNNAAKPTESIVINKPTLELVINRSKLNPTASLSAKIKGSTTGKTWFSDNINVATVTSGGKVTAVSEGTANIYCRTADGTVSEPCAVTVKAYRIDSENIRENIAYVNALDTCELSLTTSDDHGAVTWKSSNASVASIDADGVVTAKKKGTVTITATTPDKKKDTVKLIVLSRTAGLSLKSDSVSIYEGKTTTLKAIIGTKSSNEPVFWSSSDPSVASVTSKGVVKGLRQGIAEVTASTFNGKVARAVVTVRSKAVSLEFTQVTPALYMGGETGEFTVKIASPANSNDTITWSTSNKKVVSIENISADGKTITVKSGIKGTANITAKAGSGKKITYKVTSVNQAAESITLSTNSASIYVGKTVTLKAKTILPKGCNDIVVWESMDPSIATVDQNGKVIGVSQGTVTIKANSFGGVENSVEVTVRTRATAITVDQSAVTVKIGETAEISVDAIAPEGCNDTLAWTTSSKLYATVSPSEDGMTAVITGVKKGTATVTVKTGSGKYAKVKVTVAP